MPQIEFYSIVLVVTAAMMLLAQSNHFVMFFVALETITVGLYILVSYFRTNPLVARSRLKYLVTGALSSAILLFGIVLLYGVAGKSHARRDALRAICARSSRRIPTTSSRASASSSCSAASPSKSARFRSRSGFPTSIRARPPR